MPTGVDARGFHGDRDRDVVLKVPCRPFRCTGGDGEDVGRAIGGDAWLMQLKDMGKEQREDLAGLAREHRLEIDTIVAGHKEAVVALAVRVEALTDKLLKAAGLSSHTRSHCSLCPRSSSGVNFRPLGCLSLYAWTSAWQSKQRGIAFSISSVPPSDLGSRWSVSILTPQKRWQTQHRRWHRTSRLATSVRSKPFIRYLIFARAALASFTGSSCKLTGTYRMFWNPRRFRVNGIR